MLRLDQYIKLDAAAIASPNLCDKFSLSDLKRIGIECHEGWKRDELSRAVWMKRNEAGMNLALQIVEDKNFPWPGASNVAFPMVSIAAIQFHARAYPTLIPPVDVVKCEVMGRDLDGSKTERAERVSTDMSWQVLKQDRCWQTEEDKCLLNVSIVGTAFKKSFYDGMKRHNLSELVLAKNLVLNYWAKSVEECERKTHLIPFTRNEIYSRVMRGTFRNILEEAWYQGPAVPQTSTKQIAQDNRQGVMPPQADDTTTFLFGEQHVNMDLDDDGYAEPYIITFDTVSGEVLRIVTRFDSEDAIERVGNGPNRGKIIGIKADEYFTKRSFIPSPDGGIYDIGFGVFLGPLNASVNTLINQLIDAGTMQVASGGFLGRGAKIRGGSMTFAPFEWKRVDSTGDDLRKNLVPLQPNAPSEVLFNLLGLLLTYINRLASTTETNVGENPGQNTPASNMQTMVEMGNKVYTAIFKRQWAGLGDEFRKLYSLNAKYLPDDFQGPGGSTREDYLENPDAICPAADPAITSDQQALQQAMLLDAQSKTTPGYNQDAVQRRVLKAAKISAPDEVFPGTQGQPPAEDPKVTLEKIKQEGATQRAQMELASAQQQFALEMMEEQRLNNAKIAELFAKAQEASANAQSEEAYAQIAIINAEISRAKTRNDALNARIGHVLEAAKLLSDHTIKSQPESESK